MYMSHIAGGKSRAIDENFYPWIIQPSMGEYVFDASPEWIMNTLDTPDIYL